LEQAHRHATVSVGTPIDGDPTVSGAANGNAGLNGMTAITSPRLAIIP
jgi:hypothetical protein